ncbi:hypothetical protein CPB84DRAFT_1749208 [Gymnopilus junonius]|uniref:Uncharacterized protein n=1 Tax=Gymnopilus junonius TaxID=109634 RepID=A0A9P5TJV8_GYMJU|nr:hypothetical protein CPB84DRAFT_1749208 [Gymnopilus junonius]
MYDEKKVVRGYVSAFSKSLLSGNTLDGRAEVSNQEEVQILQSLLTHYSKTYFASRKIDYLILQANSISPFKIMRESISACDLTCATELRFKLQRLMLSNTDSPRYGRNFGYPISILGLVGERQRDWSSLDCIDGLKVTWKVNNAEYEYKCGSGSPEKLNFSLRAPQVIRVLGGLWGGNPIFLTRAREARQKKSKESKGLK